MSAAQPDRARDRIGQPPISCSIGASARPSRIEPAIIEPGVISPLSTTQAPRPSIADCRKKRRVFDSVENWLTTSAEARLACSARLRFACQRARTARRMPRPWTTSACWRTVSAKPSEAIAVAVASTVERLVIIWLARVMATRTRPPPTANQPSSGWKLKIAKTKSGVHGRSKSAKSTGEAMNFCTASRSRSPDHGLPRSPETRARERPVSKTLGSRRVWISAPTRAAMRPRA